MSSLPMDTVNIILEYAGYHVFRHGKYMKRLHNGDARYTMLLNQPLTNVVTAERSNNRRIFIMMNIDNQKWLCLCKHIYYEYIEMYLSTKIYPLVLNENQIKKVRTHGYGVLSLGAGDQPVPDGFAVI